MPLNTGCFPLDAHRLLESEGALGAEPTAAAGNVVQLHKIVVHATILPHTEHNMWLGL